MVRTLSANFVAKRAAGASCRSCQGGCRDKGNQVREEVVKERALPHQLEEQLRSHFRDDDDNALDAECALSKF